MRDHQVLIPVSRGYPCLGGRLLTCYSPVRHSVPEGTPCDLHVLSTPPAFVLSQNQTLHNINLRNCWTIRIELFCLAHFNSDSAVLPRSEVPENFIPAQATARVTTFSFPLLSLSGAPPGRLLASELHFCRSRRLGKSYLENCLARWVSKRSSLSFRATPWWGAGQSLSQTGFRVKLIFAKKFENFSSPCPNSHENVWVRHENNFFVIGQFLPRKAKTPPF